MFKKLVVTPTTFRSYVLREDPGGCDSYHPTAYLSQLMTHSHVIPWQLLHLKDQPKGGALPIAADELHRS